MSIFTRDCPQCARNNPVSATYCRCGYCFEPDKVNGSAQALELEAQEEKLYLDYLKARVSQTEEAARAARAVAAADPASHAKAAEALLAEQALINARAELSDQAARVRIVTQRMESVRTVIREPAAAKIKFPARAARHFKHRRTGKPAAPVKDQAPSVPTPAVTMTPRPVPQTVEPNEVFRAVQAARASEVMKEVPAVARRIIPPPVPAPVPALPENPIPAAVAPPPPAPVVPVVVATPPVLLKKSDPAHKDCPNCYASVAVSIVRCRCGYEFSNGPQLPSLTLTAAERAQFLSFSFSKPGKPG